LVERTKGTAVYIHTCEKGEKVCKQRRKSVFALCIQLLDNGAKGSFASYPTGF